MSDLPTITMSAYISTWGLKSTPETVWRWLDAVEYRDKIENKGYCVSHNCDPAIKSENVRVLL